MNTIEQYSLENVLDALWQLNQEKWVDKILNSVKEKIFANELNSENIDEFKKFVREFTSIYYLMKAKFSEVERSTGERYFEHLREVVNNVLNLPYPNTNKVLIAIAHDSIEDTNKTFEWLNEDFWFEIAIAVDAISKKPWQNYIDESIENISVRNKQAKKVRNAEYFWHLESFESFKNHVSNIAQSKNIILTEDQIIQITLDALDVKFADRIHNLSTQWDPNDLEQVRKKVDETKKYFLEIAKSTNTNAYTKLQSLILVLEIRLNNANKNVENIIQVD